MLNCNENYAVPEGDPCVPPSGGIACADLNQWGISEVAVVGVDEYGLDRDLDGVACESSVAPSANSFGTKVVDVAPIVLPIAVVLGAVALFGVFHSKAESAAERRSILLTALTIVIGIALPAAGAALFAILGLS